MSVRALVDRALAAARAPSAIYVAASLLGRAGAILLVPLYTRHLTPDEYGLYGLYVSLLNLAPTIFSLGLSAGLGKAFFDEKDEAEGIQAYGAVARGLLLLASGWLALGALVAALFPPELLAPLSRRHVLLLALAGWGMCATAAAEYFFRVRERAIVAAAFPLVTFAGTAGLGILLVVGLHRGVNGVVEAPSIASFVVGLASAAYLVARFRGGRPVLPATRRAIRFSLPFVPHLLAFWLTSAGDRWVLDVFGSGYAVGTYYLATQLMSPVPMMLSAWNQGLSPAMGKVYRDEGLDAMKAKLWSWERRALVIASGTCGLIALGVPFLRLLVGARFYPALGYMPAIGLAQILDGPYYPDSNAVYYAGRSKRIVLITTSCSAFGLALSALLLPRFGIGGLLVARVLASLLQLALFATSARRVTDAAI